MKRSQRLNTDPDKARAWQDRSRAAARARGVLPRKRLPAKSAKRTADEPERARVREVVLARDRGCTAVDVVPEVRCGSPDPRRPEIEVDEIRGGAYRVDEWLDPDRCRSLCQAHHDWKTAHKQEYRRRIGDL